MSTVTNLGTTTVLNAKINEPDHDHGKYITTQEFNKLTSENIYARLAQENLGSRSDIVDFEKKILMVN